MQSLEKKKTKKKKKQETLSFLPKIPFIEWSSNK